MLTLFFSVCLVSFPAEISQKYHISKYPTLKLFRNGRLVKREYRGQRSKDAFVQFIKEQLVDPVVQLSSPEDVPKLDVRYFGSLLELTEYFVEERALL